ncbi:hypothetical protein GCM10010400_61670 [Streptomyces aculeolatus]|uniref:DUF2637 domain-containing protein n=1 Tax=Streptomyces aculeolatus TaxID=270689 RepID=UPI0027DFCEFA|nr:DUF2637 domain-containing protein [Streptomyces aculeolatus]
MNFSTMSPGQIRSAERTLSVGTWGITMGAMLFSVLTVTPLVRGVAPEGWEWTAPILPLVVDAAVVIVVRLDSTVARLGGTAGRWPAVLRWLTGIMTLALNVGHSALHGDAVGVAVHAVAPTLLIVTAEAGLAYRRAITAALERIEREQREQRERERHEREQREQAARREREQRQADAERREREQREHAERLEQQRAEREAAERREQREHEARLRREELERQERERAEQRAYEAAREERERAERKRREQVEREQREHRERQARERAEAAGRERLAKPNGVAGRKPVNTAVVAKMNEGEALEAVRAGAAAGHSVRQIAQHTGWSVGWISARLHEARDEPVAS